MATIDEFKPYGFMVSPFQNLVDPPTIPAAWLRPGTPYTKWIDSMALAIGDKLWPCWTSSGWRGRSRSSAIALTRADLNLMDKLSGTLTKKGREPCSNERHGDLFLAEDVLFAPGWGDRFSKSFKNSKADPYRMGGSFYDGGNTRFSASLPWLLKNRISRPRAYQTAKWLGRRSFALKPSMTAWSSAAISGHAYQGLMACLATFLDHRNSFTRKERADLQRLAVDIGDRRVFAGVHYPSDNVSSWWCALEAIPCMADAAEATVMTEFVVGAIKRSILYRAMRKSRGHRGCIRLLSKWL